MKSAKLFQLGGIALLLAAAVYAITNVIYYLAGQPDGPTTWAVYLSFVGDILFMLGLGTLYARQSHRAGSLGLAGYVLLVVANMLFAGGTGLSLGEATGAITTAQIDESAALTTIYFANLWIWFAGLVLFGYATYRAGVYLKYVGLLIILLAVVQRLFLMFDFLAPVLIPVFTILGPLTWALAGWALLKDKGMAMSEPAPAM